MYTNCLIGKASLSSVKSTDGSIVSHSSFPEDEQSGDKMTSPAEEMNLDLSSRRHCWSDTFFSFVGFQANPFLPVFASTHQLIKQRHSTAADLRLSVLSNFSTAYNIISIKLALSMMNNIYHTTPEQSARCSSALIAGMIVGQIAGGILGDVLDDIMPWRWSCGCKFLPQLDRRVQCQYQ